MRDEAKIAQLKKIEGEIVRSFESLLTVLAVYAERTAQVAVGSPGRSVVDAQAELGLERKTASTSVTTRRCCSGATWGTPTRTPRSTCRSSSPAAGSSMGNTSCTRAGRERAAERPVRHAAPADGGRDRRVRPEQAGRRVDLGVGTEAARAGAVVRHDTRPLRCSSGASRAPIEGRRPPPPATPRHRQDRRRRQEKATWANEPGARRLGRKAPTRLARLHQAVGEVGCADTGPDNAQDIPFTRHGTHRRAGVDSRAGRRACPGA